MRVVRIAPNLIASSELLGKKLGLLAFGNVGRNVARIAKGFGMDVYAFDEFVPAEKIEEAGVHAVANRDALFETCDVVSLHIPATAETKQSINYAVVNKMHKGGILVNTARKEVINEAELLKLMAERTDLKYICLRMHWMKLQKLQQIIWVRWEAYYQQLFIMEFCLFLL